MSDNFYKFLFVGVMIVLTIFTNRGPMQGQDAALIGGKFAHETPQKPPPVFVLQSAAQVPAKNAENEASATSMAELQGNELLVRQLLADGLTLDVLPTTSAAAPSGDYNTPSGEAGVDSANALLESPENPAKSPFYRVNSDPPPPLQAAAALVADLKSGTPFFSLKANVRWPLASITKIMTAVILSRDMTLNQSTTLVAEDFLDYNSLDSLAAGERYTIGDLRLAMLLESNNGAAEAIADFYGRDQFMAAMNAQAASWGLSDTHFSDPVGLSAANQSTAEDLALLTKNIYTQYPEVFRITAKQSSYIKELASQRRILIKNINNFVGRSDFLGGKTGYTDEAGGNLLSVFSYKRQPILIIVLGTEDRFGETEKLLNWFENNFR